MCRRERAPHFTAAGPTLARRQRRRRCGRSWAAIAEMCTVYLLASESKHAMRNCSFLSAVEPTLARRRRWRRCWRSWAGTATTRCTSSAPPAATSACRRWRCPWSGCVVNCVYKKVTTPSSRWSASCTTSARPAATGACRRWCCCWRACGMFCILMSALHAMCGWADH